MLKTEIQSFGLEYQTSSEKIIYQYQSLYKEKILSFKQLNSSFKIINKDNVIEVYKEEEKKTEREHDVDNVLIFCGGKGIRLGNLTNEVPKPLLEINKKPVLHRLASKVLNEGFKKITLATSFKHHVIESYFKENSLNIEIDFLYEEKPLGTAGAVVEFFKRNETKKLLCLNGDIFVFDDLNNICNFHTKEDNISTFGYTNYKIQFPYGVIGEIENKIDEKPILSKKILSGVNVFSDDVLKTINQTPIDMNIMYEKLISNNLKVSTFLFGDDWIDIGNKTDLDIADKYMRVVEGS